jgi:hypothetical protein
MQYFDQSWYDCAIDKLKEITKEKNNFILFDVGAGNSVLEERVKALGGQWTGFDYMPRKEGILKLNLEQPLPPDFIDIKPDVILLLEPGRCQPVEDVEARNAFDFDNSQPTVVCKQAETSFSKQVSEF